MIKQRWTVSIHAYGADYVVKTEMTVGEVVSLLAGDLEVLDRLDPRFERIDSFTASVLAAPGIDYDPSNLAWVMDAFDHEPTVRDSGRVVRKVPLTSLYDLPEPESCPPCPICKGKGCPYCDGSGSRDAYAARVIKERRDDYAAEHGFTIEKEGEALYAVQEASDA